MVVTGHEITPPLLGAVEMRDALRPSRHVMYVSMCSLSASSYSVGL
jgi:hypothetical protein